MHKKLFLSSTVSFVLLSLCLVGVVEASSTTWIHTYGGEYNDTAKSVVQTSDGGYAIAGHTFSFGVRQCDFWLIKTDESGNMEWNRTYGGPGLDIAKQLIATSDGGYAIAGHTSPFHGEADILFVKTDAFGNMEWNKTYAHSELYWASSLVETSKGGYAIAGFNLTGFCDFEVKLDVRLFKTDESGNMEWNKTYGGTQFDCASSLVETSDGGYAIAGFTVSLDDSWDVWLIKTDETGFVPEYSSWLLPSLLLTATLVIVIYKKRLFKPRT